jgi:hypothetical protein
MTFWIADREEIFSIEYNKHFWNPNSIVVLFRGRSFGFNCCVSQTFEFCHIKKKD